MVRAAHVQALAHVALLRSVQGAAEAPQLRYLAVRCNDRPVALLPAFHPTHDVYRAELEFAEPGFAIDAVPAEGSEFANADEFSSTKLVEPGGEVRNNLDVRTSHGSGLTTYSVQIMRHSGEEVLLRDLTFPGVDESQPSFTPHNGNYTVLMPAELDRLEVNLQLWDSGQSLEVTAHSGLKEPRWTFTTAAPYWDPSFMEKLSRPEASNGESLKPRTQVVAKDALNNKGRRLLLSGETQLISVQRFFPVEVNGSRLVQIRVFPANRNTTLNRMYHIHAFRQPCPPQRPFYAPDVRLCAMTCNDGYFPRHASSRCEACPEHCARCSSYERCEVCKPSQWQTLYFLQHVGGQCHVLRIHLHELGIGAGLDVGLAVGFSRQ